jgi:glycosyltransferase involved in cell wall biosynthesis
MISTTLIIAFYNNFEYFQLVLAGLENQTFDDFEVLIADDGSRPQIVEKLNAIVSDSHLNIVHIWHEDKGFRKNKILNQAITQSKSEYLIFIDGDCIPHKEFIREHYQHREKGIVLTGRRVNLSSSLSEKLTPELIKSGFLDSGLITLLRDGLLGRSKDVEKAVYLRSRLLRYLFNRKQRGLLGCNMSIHKDDILSINGFDERYEAPAVGEDTDIQYRLELNDVRIKSLNQMAIQYHLYHEYQIRSPENLKLFQTVQESRRSFTPYGIVKTENA